MNRSLNRSFRAPERREIGSLRVKDNNNKDEDLALFREMRKREKERNDLLLLHNSDEFESPIGPVTGNPQQIYNLTSATSVPLRKSGADNFLNSENDKNDYDWLLTPPGTPLFPSLEMESQKTVMSQLGTPKARPTALRSRLANPQLDSTARSNFSARPSNSSPGLNTSTGSLRRPSSSNGPNSRPRTPTGRPTISSSSRSSLTSSNKPTSTSSTRPSSTTSSKLTSNATSRPSRSSTPTSRPTLTSAKPVGPPRSSTPTARSTSRSSTPTRASTPTRRPSTMSSTTIVVKSPSSSLNTKPVSTTTAKPVQPRSNSPSLRPKPWKPSEMPDFSLDAPPNLRTSLSDRPPSATRGRPGAPSSRSSSVEPAPNGRARRQSCSPARGRAPNGVLHNSGSSVPVSAANRLRAKANDNVSPGLYGTKMVERVINMRKLVPPKQDDKHSPHSNLSGKSSSRDSSGFGRNLSKKSLDMAIRHMDIRRTIPGNLRPLMTDIPASSMYSVRSGPARSRTVSISDSPLATSSNGSSEVSVNNNALCADGPELDDDVSSHKGIRSPASLRGR